MNSDVRQKPAYLKMYDQLKSQIMDGQYSVGSLLPPEPQLEKMFFVSRTTVRKAVGLLVEDGLVSVRQGYGTTVLNQRISQSLNAVTSISQTFAKKGYRIGTKSMYIRILEGDGPLAEQLCLSKKQPIAEINRIQTAGDSPVTIAKNYIPYALVPDIENETENIVSLYSYLEKRYHILMDSSKDTVSACNANFEDSQLLQVAPGTALLTIQRTCYRNHQPIEVDSVKIIADKYAFQISSCRN